MANVASGNSIYVDSAGVVTSTPTNLLFVVLTATSANAILHLEDSATGDAKMNLRLATAGDSIQFSFSDQPIFFSGGIEVTSVTNCVATFVTKPRGN